MFERIQIVFTVGTVYGLIIAGFYKNLPDLFGPIERKIVATIAATPTMLLVVLVSFGVTELVCWIITGSGY